MWILILPQRGVSILPTGEDKATMDRKIVGVEKGVNLHKN